MVLMIFQPPAAVPRAMVSAHTILIQVAMDSLPAASVTMGCRRNSSHWGASCRVPAFWAPTRARAMMPMVFWASLLPWLKPM